MFTMCVQDANLILVVVNGCVSSVTVMCMHIRVHVHVYVSRPEVDVSCLPPSFSTFLPRPLTKGFPLAGP